MNRLICASPFIPFAFATAMLIATGCTHKGASETGSAEATTEVGDGGSGDGSGFGSGDGSGDGFGAFVDNDGDGVLSDENCDDNDASVPTAADPECDGFYLHANGVIVRCPDVTVGARGTVDGVVDTKVDRSHLDRVPSGSQPALEVACISRITDLSVLYELDTLFDSDISRWDTSSVTDMGAMSSTASAFNQDIRGWDTSNVVAMDDMFNLAAVFNQDLSGWCVRQFAQQPSGFDAGADPWTESRPVWGTSP